MTIRREPYTIPWTDAEVEALARFQTSGIAHPLTCNGGLPWQEHVHDHEVLLKPTSGGLICPECGRVQTWLP